ncbi:hypothetical protein HELRODRAFT_160992 [Helobdella robusta]|uniref:Secreted protein n=1 Tax=Helobdella robusta TaxID=6412 RepID=T1EQZ2_HELRO|nr:hypothetical protein HELRODRAFT_160992 [Helobdella robusta]ESO01823.1 hypothetical protein HELRODRAFT_160992 [Helobdella robusta]
MRRAGVGWWAWTVLLHCVGMDDVAFSRARCGRGADNEQCGCAGELRDCGRLLTLTLKMRFRKIFSGWSSNSNDVQQSLNLKQLCSSEILNLRNYEHLTTIVSYNTSYNNGVGNIEIFEIITLVLVVTNVKSYNNIIYPKPFLSTLIFFGYATKCQKL